MAENMAEKRSTFAVEGMHCSSCALAIEKAQKRRDGIADADLTFATEKLEVKYDPGKVNIPFIKEVVEKVGFKALLEDEVVSREEIHFRGTGTDIAAEAADVTLLTGDLRGVVHAIGLSREAFRIIKQNFIYAFLFNGIGLPFAGLLSPVLASLAMAVSSLAVVGNSLRLKRVAARKLFRS